MTSLYRQPGGGGLQPQENTSFAHPLVYGSRCTILSITLGLRHVCTVKDRLVSTLGPDLRALGKLHQRYEHKGPLFYI